MDDIYVLYELIDGKKELMLALEDKRLAEWNKDFLNKRYGSYYGYIKVPMIPMKKD